MDANDDSHLSATAKVRRPESSLSSRSKFTPQSSNTSFANLQPRSQGTSREREWIQDRSQNDRREMQGASLLQERLKEKKAARLSERRRSRDLDVVVDDNAAHVTQSSPVKATQSARIGSEYDGRPNSSGGRTVSKKGLMGIKEMEETVSTLHKQNFDLKLELYHRRERQSQLEERLEAAEAQIAEQVEIQAINDQLLAELEKRDQAVEEAVGIICTLEEKIEKLMQERNAVRSFDAQYQPTYTQYGQAKNSAHNQDSNTSLSQSNGPSNDTAMNDPRLVATRLVARMPSFLSEKSEGAEALRSLYLPSEHHSPPSLPKLSEENGNNDRYEEADGMNSPRLSVLSESSFVSVYGEKNLARETLDLDDIVDAGSPSNGRHRKSLSVEKWIDERAKATARSPERTSPRRGGSLRKDQYSSINDILESPLQKLEKLQRTLLKQGQAISTGRQLSNDASAERVGAVGRRENKVKRDTLRRTEMNGFEHGQPLPPTPDTISTSTLRFGKSSNDTLNRGATEQEPERGRPHFGRSSTVPLYHDDIPIRPHSAGETVTSRREGHGWDTVTQSEITETNSDIDAPSTFDPWMAMGREKPRRRIEPPDMFTFGADDDDEWGRDMMFNRDDDLQLPPLKPFDHNYSREAEPRSDKTVTASSRLRRSNSTSSPTQYPPLAQNFINLPTPNPPERRSSLAISPGHDKKLRKQQTVPAAPSVSFAAVEKTLVSTNANTTLHAHNNTIRSRITSKIFGLGRSDPPAASVRANPGIAAAPPHTDRSVSHNEYANANRANRAKRNSIDLGTVVDTQRTASATPPPILRYPKPRDESAQQTIMPVTSSSVDSKLQGTGGYDDGFGVDGACDERERLDRSGHGNGNDNGDAKSQTPSKKWFGLRRNGSLRR